MTFPCSSSSSSSFRLCLFAILIISLQFKPNSTASLNKHRKLSSQIQANQTSSCNIFAGNWVQDESYPIYDSSTCPFIEPEFDCQSYGRPDSDYLKFRWQPSNCDLPKFNGVDFLEKVKGKTVMFVGDSLGRNQWESLICMILSSLPKSSSTKLIKNYPFTIFKFLEYEVTLSYHKAPLLVDIDTVGGKSILKLDKISNNAEAWVGVDLLSFNTGHWWVHQGSQKGWDTMESGGNVVEDMDRLSALEEGLRTWAKWVESHVDPTKTRLVFQSISPNHNNPAEWSSTTAKNCYGEKTPITGIANPADGYPPETADQMKVLTTVLGEMKNPPFLLDITVMSAMRKDGHPSIYSGQLTSKQKSNPNTGSDCSHWCLPGLPDSWNQLFYTALFS